MFDLTMMAIW